MSIDELIKKLEHARFIASIGDIDWLEVPDDEPPWLSVDKIWVIGPNDAEGLDAVDMEAIAIRHNTAAMVLSELKTLSARATKAEAMLKIAHVVVRERPTPTWFLNGMTEDQRAALPPKKATVVTADGESLFWGEGFSLVDATFIAHARTDVPALLAMVEELKEVNAGLRRWQDVARPKLETERDEALRRVASVEERYKKSPDQRRMDYEAMLAAMAGHPDPRLHPDKHCARCSMPGHEADDCHIMATETTP